MKRPTVINFFSGPGAGKSTQAAMLFAELKCLGVNVELVTEYAKDQVWQEGYKVLSNQLYIFGKQQHRLWRCADQVDIIVTDAPLLHSMIYGKYNSLTFNTLIKEEFNKFDNINIFLERADGYSTVGRHQNLDEAKKIDQDIKDLVEGSGYRFGITVKVGNNTAKEIIEKLEPFIHYHLKK